MTSVWTAYSERTGEPSKVLDRALTTDVLVIGGGMAGVLTAFLLTQAGRDCVLLEGRRVGSGTTQGTTAKVTAQHGLIYDRLLKERGEDVARRYFVANQNAVEGFRCLSQAVPCDFEERTAYLYAEGSTKPLEQELAAYEQLGIPHKVLNKAPLPLKNNGALGMQQQAQFNPLKLLYGLLPFINVYEDTFVSDVKGDTAHTPQGSVTARHIVFATRYPLVNIPGLYFMKLHQERSYSLALEGALQPDGMFIGVDDGFSFRTYGEYLLVGGGGHRTGEGPGPKQGYRKIRGFTRRAYPQAVERYAWAAQDCMSLDHVPYVGIHRREDPNWYVATGFSKWGMTGSLVAAELLADLIVEGGSDAADVFSPQRSMLHASLASNLGTSTVNLVKPGKRCSHMGCTLAHNNLEDTWDCPCHGSRFSSEGAVVEGPATKGIDVGK
ncbi:MULTISPECIES: FAD-dependent oxidoreductase [Gordonibacter]|uniref:FAD-dependent oxidoreductase n=1 Tax=Gordonibacter faecis TaxID=3047475 RepID=A0ABT7DMQ6_9ACTN|nr:MULTISPECIES: FAD-dependent oxidoreductase [unclassified Gordonibacter]MDJ1650811.1 FAD-dependent oxidoreductase [Gordonibacter sp. KGMB12511]HIW77159.1 FAD-dependent oxidoreductase [Candidatus Gordonibacter avicola]